VGDDRGKTERGRRSIVKSDRERSTSRTQRGRHSITKGSSQSQSQRGRRCISRSKSPSPRPPANESKVERRPSSRSSSRSKSRSASRRPSTSELQKGRRPSSRGKSRSPSHGPSTRERRPSSRSKSPSRRALISETNNRGRSTSASRSREAQQQGERSSSRVRRPSVKAQARERSTSTVQRKTSCKNLKLSHEGISTARRESSSKNVKNYETLSKEDLLPSKQGDASRRPRSLSRTRRIEGESITSGAMGSLESQLSGNQHTRVSRSLSRTRSKRGEHEGIGDYLQKQQPEKKNRIDDETNSQTTGTSSNGTNEILYATPSWMWQNSSKPAQSSFFKKDAFADFNAHNQSQKDHNQSATSFGSNSYDASAEMATPRSQASNSTWGTPAGSIGDTENKNTPLQETLNSATSTNISPPLMNTRSSSMGSFPISATTGTKAKEFYGKVIKQEQAQLRKQSELLFHTLKSTPPEQSLF
jgi:hypothetical protein